MRVAIFTNNFLPRLSGVSVAVNFLVTALRDQGHETLVVAPEYGFGSKVKGVEVFRVKSVYLMPMHLALPLPGLEEKAIRELVLKWRPELIHSQHPFLLGKAAMELADELGLPLVYTFHTLYDFFAHYFMLDTDAVKKAVREYVIRYANRCDLVIAPTDPIKDYLGSIGVRARLESVPTGIDCSRFQQVTPAQVDALRGSYGLQGFERVLLSVGRISKEKNVGLALKTLSELWRRGRNYGLLLLGDGPEVAGLKREAEKLRIADRVVFGGFLDQETLAAAYFLGDVFLFPSLSDTQGIVLYEAQAAGLPVVAVDSMASRAVVHPGQNGLFALDDPGDFADKVEEILADRDRFGQNLELERFSYRTLGQTYERLYGEARARGRKPDPQATRKLSRLVEEIRGLM